MGKNILITGVPGCGKTTLFKRLAKELSYLHPVGFYTQEIREGGVRQGFTIREGGVRQGFTLNGLDGSSGVLAHVDFAADFRVGRYRVDVAGFEDFIGRISSPDQKTKLVMIDEIGKMECFSEKFKMLISDVLESENMLIATVAMKGGGLIATIKRRPNAQLFEVTRKNQGDLLSQILKLVNHLE
jgi:nucleoside-triphosphatase